ncbi:MAG: hypothetical protein JKY61_12225 [Planctomycetes bacterium]|nr:hypothetical protein [Planctomycetota bacterium]
MWLCSPDLGFFSIVLADDDMGQPDPNLLMVRARRKEHLVLLQERCEGLAGAEIIESALTDYRWRLIVKKEAFATAMSEIVMDLDYRNVKSRAHREEAKVGKGFVSALHRVWSVLHEIQ